MYPTSRDIKWRVEEGASVKRTGSTEQSAVKLLLYGVKLQLLYKGISISSWFNLKMNFKNALEYSCIVAYCAWGKGERISRGSLAVFP